MNQQQEEKYKNYHCKICLDIATEPIITPCGHLYCWDCIYKWSEKKGNPLKCPYCSNEFDINKVTTLFAGENSSQQPQERPNRPQNPRTEARNQNQNQNGFGGLFNNVNFSFGFGYPFMMFTNFNANQPNGNFQHEAGDNQGYFKYINWFFFGIFLLQFLPGLTSSLFSSQQSFSQQHTYNRRDIKDFQSRQYENSTSTFESGMILLVTILFFLIPIALQKIRLNQQNRN